MILKLGLILYQDFLIGFNHFFKLGLIFFKLGLISCF